MPSLLIITRLTRNIEKRFGVKPLYFSTTTQILGLKTSIGLLHVLSSRSIFSFRSSIDRPNGETPDAHFTQVRTDAIFFFFFLALHSQTGFVKACILGLLSKSKLELLMMTLTKWNGIGLEARGG